MKRFSALAVVSFTAVVTLGGCGLLDDRAEGHAASAAGAQPTSGGDAQPTSGGDAQPTSGGDAKATSDGQPASTASAVSRVGSAKDEGDLPDPCTLLSKAEVVDLTGRRITQVDRDDAKPGDVTRYCQWQQDGGQLALFLTRTTEAEFDSTIAGAEKVHGVGEDAFELAGHLYVLYGTAQIDVYSRGGSDEQNLTDSIEVTRTVMPRI